MKPVTLRRLVDVCPVCGAWDSIVQIRARRTTKVDRFTGLKTIYGCRCRVCGAAVTVRYRAPKHD